MMLRGEELYLSYGRKAVLQGVTLELHSGEIVGLVGENGVGKTSLIRVLSGLTLPKKGAVKKEGETVAALVEQPSFFLDMTGKENLEYYLGRRIGKEEAAAAPFGCDSFWELPVRKYSMGMRQKLALWMLLLSEADYLLLDEPSVALDAPALEEFDQLLLKQKSLRGILIAGHNFQELQRVCDRVLVMVDGRIRKELGAETDGREIYRIVLRGAPSEDVKGLLAAEGLSLSDNRIEFAGSEQELSALLRKLILAGAEVCEAVRLHTLLEKNCLAIMKEKQEAADEKGIS